MLEKSQAVIKLIAWRKNNNLTQYQAGKKLGYSTSMIKSLEKGDRRPSDEKKNHIEQVTNKLVSYFDWRLEDQK